jgi:hypothetical protein
MSRTSWAVFDASTIVAPVTCLSYGYIYVSHRSQFMVFVGLSLLLHNHHCFRRYSLTSTAYRSFIIVINKPKRSVDGIIGKRILNHFIMTTDRTTTNNELSDHQQSSLSSSESSLSWMIRPLPISTVRQPEYWPPRNVSIPYDWSCPTNEVYKWSSTSSDSDNERKGRVDDNRSDTNIDTSVASVVSLTATTTTTTETMTNRISTAVSPTTTIASVTTDQIMYTPTFRDARKKLDYTYHTHVVINRQYLQDAILQRIVQPSNVDVSNTSSSYSSSSNGSGSSTSISDLPNVMNQETNTTIRDGNVASITTNTVPLDDVDSSDTNRIQERMGQPQPEKRPWIVFTAGPMGVGKGYVLTQLQQANLFDVSSFVKIDPDLIKYELPEMVGYLQKDRATAASKLHRESTQMADIIFEYAVTNSMSILVDGSLRDVVYYESLFRRIRTEYPSYRIAIIHITASRDVIYNRAATRANITGRVVPTQLLEESIQQVPKSVAKLSPLADAVHVIANQPNQPLELISSTVQLPMKYGMTEPCNRSRTSTKVKITWDDFARSWYDDATTTDTSHETVNTQEHVPPAATGTNEVSTDPTTSAKDLNYTKQQLHPMKLQRRISMSSSFDNSESHKVANDIWKNSYPNFCAQ